MNNYGYEEDVIYTNIEQRRRELLRSRKLHQKAIERYQRWINRIDEELRQMDKEME